MTTQVQCLLCSGSLEPGTMVSAGSRDFQKCDVCTTEFARCVGCEQYTSRIDEETQTCLNPDCEHHGIVFECCPSCGLWSFNVPNEDMPSATRFCHNVHCTQDARSTDAGKSARTVSESSFVRPPTVNTPSDVDRIDSLLTRIASQSHYEERYEVRRSLARGGMGEIFEAFDQILLRRVAIKRMLRAAGRGSDPAVRGQFLKEAWIGGRLLHPNVLSVFDVGVDRDDRIYYTMRLVDGASLQESLGALQTGVSTRLVGYPLRRIVRSFLGACHGIDFAHQNGILHLDLKPHNILMSGFEEVFVIDWGLARLDDQDDTERLADLYSGRATEDSHDTMFFDEGQGRVVGTPTYMAPEQAEGANSRFDETTDVYGLGGVLHFILYGCGPNDARSALDVIRQSQGQATGPKRELRSGILPRGKRIRERIAEHVTRLEGICHKCLEVDQDQRYLNVDELIVEVDEWLDGATELAEFLD